MFSRGVADDVEGCLGIARGLPEYFTPSAIETMGRDLAAEELYVARCNLEPVGFVCVKEKSPDVFEILWMAVRKTRTGCGIGTLIMDNLYRNLKSQGARLVVVKTLAPTVDYPPYTRTRRFYEKNGFVLVDVIDPYPDWDPGNPCAIYVKVL